MTTETNIRQFTRDDFLHQVGSWADEGVEQDQIAEKLLAVRCADMGVYEMVQAAQRIADAMAVVHDVQNAVMIQGYASARLPDQRGVNVHEIEWRIGSVHLHGGAVHLPNSLD